mmetsp:Transcript_7944/g.24895  ORF Transcript_7944/g.24895 Transcript_7944/m.24895 type:complete len:117 (-) Transcript_7944:27-377(-)
MYRILLLLAPAICGAFHAPRATAAVALAVDSAAFDHFSAHAAVALTMRRMTGDDGAEPSSPAGAFYQKVDDDEPILSCAAVLDGDEVDEEMLARCRVEAVEQFADENKGLDYENSY